MDEGEDCHYVELPLGEQNEKGVMESTWTNEGWHCLLQYADKVWKAEVTESTIARFNSFLEMGDSEYRATLKRSLTDTTDFKYSFEDESLHVTYLIGSDVEVHFAEIKFQQVSDNSALCKTVRDLLLRNMETGSKLISLKRDKEALDGELKKCVESMGQIVEIKKEMEMKLYTQFLAVLNEKKRKNAELMQMKVGSAGEVEAMEVREADEERGRFSLRRTEEDKSMTGDDGEEDEDDPNPTTFDIPKRNWSQPGPSSRK